MKTKRENIRPTVESPTWGDLNKMAEKVMDQLGGNAEASRKLDGRSFYTLAILASLMLDDGKADSPIFGKRHLS